MNTFNRKSLYAALAGLGALSGMGAAEAVNLAPEGLGQALIYPYYTVRNGANGFAYNTLLSVVNTTASAKAVKVRFLEGKNSKEVLDFNLFLSRFDVWTAAVVATANGAAVTSTDNSCILPEQLPAAGQNFVNFAYSSDGADSSLDRTREGYVEILEMATFPDNSTTALIVTHSNGVPGQGSFTCADNSDSQAANDASAPQGGLFGGLTLINVFDGSAYSQDATALDHVFDSAVYNNAGDIGPTFNDASPPISVVVANGEAVITDWTVTTRPIDAVSAVLMHNSVMNEYVTEPGLLANTDWIVTMPTKNQYVAVGTGTAKFPPFQRNFNGTKGACDDISIDFWDREEKKNSTPGGFSPPQPGVTASLCWEANVITFKSAGVLGSTNFNFLDVNAKGFINGWAQLTFIYTNAQLIGGSTTVVGLSNGFFAFSSASATYSGLPVVGFAVQSYNNNVIVVGGKNVQSTYGADFAHRFSTDIVTP